MKTTAIEDVEKTSAVCDAMVATVMKTKDPGAWLVEVLRIVEAAGLRPERCIELPGTLQTICYGVADEARQQGRMDELRAALS